MAPQAPVEISTGRAGERADEGLSFRSKMIEAALEAPAEQLVFKAGSTGATSRPCRIPR